MRLYSFFRSSAAFRVRIALNLKNISHDTAVIHLPSGAQTEPAYREVNPQGRVPSLETDGAVLTQSLAIIEYLDETHPAPPLLPNDAIGRAHVRALAGTIACDIHPLQNLAVLVYLRDALGAAEGDVTLWARNWIKLGFDAIETMLERSPATGRFCHGDAPGLADICVVPQVFNARRFECPLDDYPTLMGVFDECMKIEAFDAAQPSKQPDAPAG